MWGQLESQAQAGDPALLVPLGAGKLVECGSHFLRRLGGDGGDLLRGRRFAPGQQIERRWNDLEEVSPTRGPQRRRDTGCQFLELIGFHLVSPLGHLDTLRTSLPRGSSIPSAQEPIARSIRARTSSRSEGQASS